jgi:hypothetical protein
MQITGQYRYLDDVNEDRVSAIYYMKPFWPDLLNEGEDDDKIEAATEAGFDTIDPYAGAPDVTLIPAYKGVPAGKRKEYHGTSLGTVKLALPGIVLPEPPPLDPNFPQRL